MAHKTIYTNKWAIFSLKILWAKMDGKFWKKTNEFEFKNKIKIEPVCVHMCNEFSVENFTIRLIGLSNCFWCDVFFYSPEKSMLDFHWCGWVEDLSNYIALQTCNKYKIHPYIEQRFDTCVNTQNIHTYAVE